MTPRFKTWRKEIKNNQILRRSFRKTNRYHWGNCWSVHGWLHFSRNLHFQIKNKGFNHILCSLWSSKIGTSVVEGIGAGRRIALLNCAPVFCALASLGSPLSRALCRGFAKSRPAAHDPPRPSGPAARRPSGPRPAARGGPAARQSGGPDLRRPSVSCLTFVTRAHVSLFQRQTHGLWDLDRDWQDGRSRQQSPISAGTGAYPFKTLATTSKEWPKRFPAFIFEEDNCWTHQWDYRKPRRYRTA